MAGKALLGGVSRSTKVDEKTHGESLKALVFESEDPLAQRSFWISAAYMLKAAMDSLYGANIVSGSPTVESSQTGALEGISGFTYDAVFVANTDPIEYGADQVEARKNVDQALINLLDRAEVPRIAKSDLESLEKFMKRYSSANHEFIEEVVPWREAWNLFALNPLKLDAMLRYAEQNNSTYPDIPIVRLSKTQFVDLAPWQTHDAVLLRNTKPIKATKLLSWSTASIPENWKHLAPNAKQVILRLKGIAFPSSNDLQLYLARMSDLEKADHRALGLAQNLFFAHDSSPGTPFVLVHGMRLVRKMERAIRDLYDAYGYEEVQTPQLFHSSLWKQSGHWDKYREDMFGAQGFNEEALQNRSCCSAHDSQSHLFGLKPMNCPGHCVLFAHQPRSYRDLPMRVAEFSPLHRNEASGALSGLTRVRRFHQDDAHVFCTPEQVSNEIQSMLQMLALAYGVFGFGDRFELVLSTRPENYIGDLEVWNAAEESLKQALDKSGRPWVMNEGDGAFYGPKIDIRLVDAMGRKHQTATIQLDFQLPQRFQLEYALPDPNKAIKNVRTGHARPVMIHRAILGSFERFLAILAEQCRGWWPFWLSPRQAIILPAYSNTDPNVQQQVTQYAKKVQSALTHGMLDFSSKQKLPFLSPSAAHHTLKIPSRSRFHVDLPAQYLHPSGETLSKKVRQAQLSRSNFIIIVGQQEAENSTVSLRLRDERHAPAWHTSVDQTEAPPAKVQDMILSVARSTFPSKQFQDRVDLGQWTLDEVRHLFCVLDTLHV
ncbi:threonine--tRNA ligase [Malassezia psittaci]|uniref:threonine--tRNA ligase n=1 Tax=Malassezia psittaci TaxID=1821823 RepID=A0AAF0FA95_9BASI|nr:threonine--tRNA ligase [Malassezia psittaci]